MENEETCTKCLVPKGTTHLMIWLNGELPTNRLIRNCKEMPTYSAQEGSYNCVNYVATLKGECKKISSQNEACILVYDSRMATTNDIENMKKIVKDIENCYLVDYKEYSKKMDDIELLYHEGPEAEHEVFKKKCKLLHFIEEINSAIFENIEYLRNNQ